MKHCLLAVPLFLVGCVNPFATQSKDAVEMTVPFPPQAVLIEGKVQLAYEVKTSDFRSQGLELKRFEVLDEKNRVLVGHEGKDLEDKLRLPSDPLPTAEELKFTGKLRQPTVLLWLALSTAPVSLRHRLTFAKKGGEVVTEGASCTVNREAPISLSPPVRGENWIALEASSNLNHHRKALLTIDGNTTVPQRFAIDWMTLGSNGDVIPDEPTKNENYPCYGTELLAVADGTVVKTQDGLADNVPPNEPPNPTEQTAGGNFIILDLGNGRYAFYAHCQPGSLKVKAGDPVKRGDVLAKLGNSGSSSAPHLHFHVSNRPSPLACEGLPFVFDAFTKTGGGSADGQVVAIPPEARQGELPAALGLYRF